MTATQPEGFWAVRHGELLAAVFPGELEALRYVATHGGTAALQPWGEVDR